MCYHTVINAVIVAGVVEVMWVSAVVFYCNLQGICTLEGEEHSDREKGPDPEPRATHA